ncbi:hypothetical protein BDB01DRAFT_799649 [Pilobolus umbonatus]|nr:hypothetical protein BDB01DRAFT_799649 [Pilobolus umbonatus]
MVKSFYTPSILIVLLITFLSIITPTMAGVNLQRNDEDNTWYRPQRFRIQIYSRAHKKGEVSYIKLDSEASKTCHNLTSKYVGSYEVNDPFVKISFYRSMDCKGVSSATYQDPNQYVNSHVLIKARSMSITKVRLVK